MNYFELFNLPVQFNVDLALLTERYQQIQRQLHPDNFATATDHEKLLSVQKTAELNDAYQVLKQPLSRSEYMLSLKGVDIQHEQQTLQDPVFLMQQMELREQLEDIPSANDPESALDSFVADVKKQLAELFDELVPKLTSECQNEQASAANIIRKLKFMYKLQDEADALEDKLFN